MTRAPRPELMDDPGLDPAEHHRALDGLGRINAVSLSLAPLWPHVARAARCSGSRPLRVLDLACGGGHVAVGLARRASRTGVAVEVTGTDVSTVALAHAGRLAERCGARVDFVQLDALRDPLPSDFDVVMCSLFLHHVADGEAPALLRKMAGSARHSVFVSDLRRTRLGQAFAWVGCRALSRSRIVHVDGARSVRAAFTGDEAATLARTAGLAGVRVTHHWPQRWVLIWER